MDTIQLFYFQHQHWFVFISFLLGTFVAAHLVTFVFKHVLTKLAAKTATNLDDELVHIGQKPVYWGVILGGVYLALSQFSVFTPYMPVIKSIVQLGFILILLFVAIRFSGVFFSWIQTSKKIKKKQAGFVLTIQKIGNALIYFVAIIFILQSVGISISPLIASLGIGGLAVGLALQPTLSNYFSGLYIAADGFLQRDDLIELDGGMKGKVVSVGWRNTVIRMWNNNLVAIPNSKLSDSMITNYNEPQNKMSFIVYCGVGYGSDLEEVEKITLGLARKFQKNKEYGIADYEPVFRYHEFGDSNVNFKVVLQAQSNSVHFLMKHEFIRDLKTLFDKKNILIAFPTRSLEFLNSPKA